MKIAIFDPQNRVASVASHDGYMLDDSYMIEAVAKAAARVTASAWDEPPAPELAAIAAKGKGWRLLWQCGDGGWVQKLATGADGGFVAPSAEDIAADAKAARSLLRSARYGERTIALLRRIGAAIEAGDDALVERLDGERLILQHAPLFDVPT